MLHVTLLKVDRHGMKSATGCYNILLNTIPSFVSGCKGGTVRIVRNPVEIRNEYLLI
jgi:hypothetical protein